MHLVLKRVVLGPLGQRAQLAREARQRRLVARQAAVPAEHRLRFRVRVRVRVRVSRVRVSRARAGRSASRASPERAQS